MISKLSGLTMALFLCANTNFAQVSNYTFSQSIGSYGGATTGTLIGLPFQDDDVNVASLPFSFVYNGTTYTTVNVCSNGYISFSALSGTEWTPVSDGSTQELISVFGNDLGAGAVFMGDVTAGSNTITNCSFTSGFAIGDVLIDVNSDFGANPVITGISGNNIIVNINATTTDLGNFQIVNGDLIQSVTGTAPNRICTFEFRHFCRLTFEELLDFKINLYETSNKIEFVYGNMFATSDPSPSIFIEVGLKGLSNSDFNTREVAEPNAWSTSNASSSISDICEFSNTIGPVVGQTYAWTPANCNTPTLIVTQSPTLTCPAAAVTLSASGATSYTWANGPTTAQYNVNPLVTTTYTLIGANAECTATVTITHSIIPSPSITVSGNSPICAGVSATLIATGATSYTWTNGPSSSQYVVTPNVTTTYTINGSNGGACSGVAVVTQSVIQYPVLGITQNSTTICQGQTAVITASGATTYAWGGGQTTAQISVTPSATTVYTLTGSNAACSSTASVTQNVSLCLGVKENTLADNVSVFPNPFRNELNVSNSGSTEMTVTIADALGKTIYKTSIHTNSDEIIQTEFLNNGLYFLNLNDGTTTVTKKMVKN